MDETADVLAVQPLGNLSDATEAEGKTAMTVRSSELVEESSLRNEFHRGTEADRAEREEISSGRPSLRRLSSARKKAAGVRGGAPVSIKSAVSLQLTAYSS